MYNLFIIKSTKNMFGIVFIISNKKKSILFISQFQSITIF